MKKKYINPKFEIVTLNAPQIMAGSPPLNGIYNGGDVYAPQANIDFDFDEMDEFEDY